MLRRKSSVYRYSGHKMAVVTSACSYAAPQVIRVPIFLSRDGVSNERLKLCCTARLSAQNSNLRRVRSASTRDSRFIRQLMRWPMFRVSLRDWLSWLTVVTDEWRYNRLARDNASLGPGRTWFLTQTIAMGEQRAAHPDTVQLCRELLLEATQWWPISI